MDAGVFNEYLVATIVGICLCLGYVIKTSLTFIPNKYIPLIMLIVGMMLNIMFHIPHITMDIILAGMVSGLASTGGYEAVHQFVKNYGNGKGTDSVEGVDEEEDSSKGEDDDASN